MIVIWSFISLLFFSMIAILVLNYANYEWEEKKVNELAKHIKPQDQNSILFKSTSSREFTSFDLGNVAKTKPVKVVKNIYDKAIILIQETKYPTWLEPIIKELNNLRNNFWSTIRRFWSYILNLTKPVHTAEESVENNISDSETEKVEKKLREVDQTVERVNTLNLISQQNAQNATPLLSGNTQQSAAKTNVIAAPAKASEIGESSKNNSAVATIGMVSVEEKSELDMTLFERLESRILGKLKNKGLGHYDVWLELGDLYLKFGEKEKAREVFALVLKHSDGSEKEFARDKLIGL